MTRKSDTHWLVVVFGDVEPDIEGPFDTTDERDDRAKEVKAETGDRDGLIESIASALACAGRFPEHTKDEILANRMYLVWCRRRDEDAPFSWHLGTGAEICLNQSSFPDYYRYFLLPPFQASGNV
jgi:hypothetical protein